MKPTGKLRYIAAVVAAAAAFALSLALADYWKPRVTTVAPVAGSPQDVRVQLEGIEAPTVPVIMAAGTPTVVEIPADDFFYVVHPGDNELVTLDEAFIRPNEHSLVLRTGGNFPSYDDTEEIPPPESAKTDEERARLFAARVKASNRQWAKWLESARRLRVPDYQPPPVTMITVQTVSGATFTISVVPALDPSEATRRVVVTYDRDRIVESRRAAGLAVNLDRQQPARHDKP